MFEQAFKNIDDVLRKEAGCTTELDYTEQSSWLLFLKYLDGLEQDRATEAQLNGKKYSFILDKEYRWESWAAPKGKDGKLDHNRAMTGDDLRDFVNQKLFPYLHGFKQRASGPDTIEYKIGEIFGEIKNKIQSGYNLREIIDHVDELRFRSQTEKHELSHLYEAKIKNMGNAGRNGGEYYTPRPLIRAIVQVVNPKIGEKIYDGACGSAGFLCESFDGIRLIQTGNVGEGVFKDRAAKARYISEATFKRLRCTEIFESDCLISRLPDPVGRCCILPDTGEKMITAVDCTILRFKPIQLLPVFFNFYSQSDAYLKTVAKECTGTTRNRISRSNLGLTPIPVPPLPEQQRIVGILDEAFDGIATAKANAEKNLQNARALFESHLQSVFTSKKWKWKTLDDLCDGVEYGSSAKSKKEGKIPVLRMGNIQDGKLDWEKLVYTDDKDEIKKYLLKHNDVLFNRTNSPELVGKTAIYKSEMPAIFAGYLIRIHRKEDLLDADYLNYFLNSQIALDYGKTVVISSVNQANINGAKLKGYPIPAPSLVEQKQIVAKLDSLREETQRLESLYQQKLAALEALKKSLLNEAFTGKL